MRFGAIPRRNAGLVPREPPLAAPIGAAPPSRRKGGCFGSGPVKGARSKKFIKPQTGEPSHGSVSNGKGDIQRPAQVTDDQLAFEWRRIYGTTKPRRSEASPEANARRIGQLELGLE